MATKHQKALKAVSVILDRFKGLQQEITTAITACDTSIREDTKVIDEAKGRIKEQEEARGQIINLNKNLDAMLNGRVETKNLD